MQIDRKQFLDDELQDKKLRENESLGRPEKPPKLEEGDDAEEPEAAAGLDPAFRPDPVCS